MMLTVNSLVELRTKLTALTLLSAAILSSNIAVAQTQPATETHTQQEISHELETYATFGETTPLVISRLAPMAANF